MKPKKCSQPAVHIHIVYKRLEYIKTDTSDQMGSLFNKYQTQIHSLCFPVI